METLFSLLTGPETITDLSQTVDYTWLQENANTGDILLFSANHFIGCITKWYGATAWTHVGMIVRHDQDLFVWEAMRGKDNNRDLLKGDDHQEGVRLVDLRTRIALCILNSKCGGILYRRLVVDAGRRRQFDRIMRELEKTEDGKPFTDSLLKMVESSSSGMVYNDLKTRSHNPLSIPKNYFCSQLVTYTYMRLGLIPDDQWDPEEFSPLDFDDLFDRCSKIAVGLANRNCKLEAGKRIPV